MWQWNKLWPAKYFFHHYLIDQTTAEHAWAPLEEGSSVISDCKYRVLSTSVETDGEIIFRKEAIDSLVIHLDVEVLLPPSYPRILPLCCQGRDPRVQHLFALLPGFAKAVLRMASKVTKFMIKPLDPEYYQECVKCVQRPAGAWTGVHMRKTSGLHQTFRI